MANTYSIVNQSRLHSLYDYNPDAGQLISKLYNRPVGWKHNGYLVVNLHHEGKDRKFKVHQLIWMYLYGRWPDQMIDHIDGDPLNNKLLNLREVTAKQNSENRNKVNAISGYKGVVPAVNNRWKAQITNNCKTIYLGTYDTKKEAHMAYCKAALILHTHNNSTKFCSHKI